MSDDCSRCGRPWVEAIKRSPTLGGDEFLRCACGHYAVRPAPEVCGTASPSQGIAPHGRPSQAL